MSTAKPHDIKAREMAIEYLATSDQTGDALGIYRITLTPKSPGAGAHFHKRMTEAFEVHSGTLSLLVDGKAIEAGAGDFVLVTPGKVHAFANRGDVPAVFSLTFTPALSREGYFRGLEALNAAGRMNDEAAMRDLMAEYDQYPVDGVAGWTDAVE